MVRVFITFMIDITFMVNFYYIYGQCYCYLAIVEYNEAEQGVKNSADGPRWITSSSTICIILFILRKPNSIIVLLVIQNISNLLDLVINKLTFSKTFFKTLAYSILLESANAEYLNKQFCRVVCSLLFTTIHRSVKNSGKQNYFSHKLLQQRRLLFPRP